LRGRSGSMSFARRPRRGLPSLAFGSLRAALALAARCARGREPEALVALALAAFAGLRVLGFALAFPFFTNVDEFRHVDMALKYARGYVPGRETDAYEAETRRLVAILGSPEYHRDARSRSPLPPPVWRAGPEVLAQRIARMEAELAPIHNLEANQSPFYYTIAGAWLRLGRAFGFDGGPLLYWLRGLAAPAAFALVLAAHRVLRRATPRSRFVRLGVPALLACVPQDCVYYATSDALSPLLGGIAFLLCVDLALRAAPGAWRGAAAGAVGAAAILTKLPNAMLVPVAAFCAVAGRVGGRAPGADGRRCAWLALFATLCLPVAWWLARNALLLGDPMGDARKIETLGWGLRPLGEWLAHPLLGPEGLAAFLAGLARTFWRGEIAWNQATLALPAADRIYVAASAVCLALAATGLRGARPRGERVAEGAAWVAVLSALAILAWLSVRFSYGAATNPSLERPWFANGRLVSGVLVPFALLFVRGIERGAAALPECWRERGAWTALGAILAVACASEALLSAPVFGSPYNFFRLP